MKLFNFFINVLWKHWTTIQLKTKKFKKNIFKLMGNYGFS